MDSVKANSPPARMPGASSGRGDLAERLKPGGAQIAGGFDHGEIKILEPRLHDQRDVAEAEGYMRHGDRHEIEGDAQRDEQQQQAHAHQNVRQHERHGDQHPMNLLEPGAVAMQHQRGGGTQDHRRHAGGKRHSNGVAQGRQNVRPVGEPLIPPGAEPAPARGKPRGVEGVHHQKPDRQIEKSQYEAQGDERQSARAHGGQRLALGSGSTAAGSFRRSNSGANTSSVSAPDNAAASGRLRSLKFRCAILLPNICVPVPPTMSGTT